MKRMGRITSTFFVIIAAVVFAIPRTDAQTSPTATPDERISGIFEGITPCDNVARPMPQIPTDATCEELIWKITLYHDPDTLTPTTYELDSAYGMSQPNTTGLRGGGMRIALEGEWEINQGTQSNPNATIYTLNPETPDAAIHFVRLDENVLHVLAPDMSLMVGNGGWSYTLNRTDSRKEIVPLDAASTGDAPVPVADGSDTRGVFDGRTPCADSIYAFTQFPRRPNCIKIKMRLTLYQDADTGQPTNYHLKGTETTRDGTWSESRGTKADPNAVVYRLNIDDTGTFIAFLKADDNNLLLLDDDFNLMVGDRLWSYTLSRKS